MPISRGRPLSSASMFMPKLVCIAVKRNRWFSTTSALASRLISTTMRMPERSLSSRRSEMPSISLLRTRSAMRSISVALFT